MAFSAENQSVLYVIAIHHLDIPWRPSDIVQREGRLIRQGNTNKKVFRFRYITAGTFDAYSWQILENKQRFIAQFMSNNLSVRDVGDIDDSVLNYAEIKALSVGDPLLKSRIDTANELERLKIQCRQRDQELKVMQRVVSNLPALLGKLNDRRSSLKQDYDHYLVHRERLSNAERREFGEELLEALKGNAFSSAERWFDDLHGFRVLLPAFMKQDRPAVLMEGASGARYDVDMRDAKPAGCILRCIHICGKRYAVSVDECDLAVIYLAALFKSLVPVLNKCQFFCFHHDHCLHFLCYVVLLFCLHPYHSALS